jgi:hypothetical protein
MKRKHVEHDDDDQLYGTAAARKVVRTAKLWASEKMQLLIANEAVQRADEAVLRADKRCRKAQATWADARNARNGLRTEATDTLQAYEAARAEARVEASYARAAPEQQVKCFMYFKYFVFRH